MGFLFTAVNENRVIDKFNKRCCVAKMHRLEPADALDVFLSVAQRERVGYEHRGACMLFKHPKAGKGELGRAIRALQRTFSKWEYASYVEPSGIRSPFGLIPAPLECGRRPRSNVVRASTNARDLGPPRRYVNACKEFAPETFSARRRIDAAASLGDPVDRCPVCTLRPPCQHVSEKALASRGLERRSKLPARKDSIDCPHFVKYGACRIFNEFGHCSRDSRAGNHRNVADAF